MRSNILKCLEGSKNNLVFKKITKLKDLKTNNSSLKTNYNFILMSFRRVLNFHNIINRMIIYNKNSKIILVSTDKKKIISNQIQFFQDVFRKIKLLLDKKIKMFLSQISITISSIKLLFNNNEHTFNTIIIIIKC